MTQNIIFYQLLEPTTSTYTYLLADPMTKEALLIDSVLETVDRDLTLIDELGLKLVTVLDTHIHADHITGAGEIRKRRGITTGVSKYAGVDCSDILLADEDEISIGRFTLKALTTPGHTDSCMSFYGEGRVFTGDSLLIRSAGRTDFQQGSSANLYASITQKLFTLPDETLVFPGHDYHGLPYSTIGLEKKYNQRLNGQTTQAQFIATMNELKLAQPKKIHIAIPANLKCGLVQDSLIFHPQIVAGIPEISSEDLNLHLGKVRVLDVRRPEEFSGELGHIPGAILATLGPEFLATLQSVPQSEEVVFVCRSGARSGQAVLMSRNMGFTNTINLAGGMIDWNIKNFPIDQ